MGWVMFYSMFWTKMGFFMACLLWVVIFLLEISKKQVLGLVSGFLLTGTRCFGSSQSCAAAECGEPMDLELDDAQGKVSTSHCPWFSIALLQLSWDHLTFL